MAVNDLQDIRNRVLPMFQFIADEYGPRTPEGYPEILDNPELGSVGILLDPAFSLSFVSDGEQLYVDIVARSARADARSSAGWEKYGGKPFVDRRPIQGDITDIELRNFLSELVARWNMQPTIIHITDT